MAKNKRKIRVGQDAYRDSYDSKDKGGVGKKSWLNFKSSVKMFEPKEGINHMNIIPYEIKTRNHPRVVLGKAKIGDYAYNLDVYVHTYVGLTKAAFVCPKKTYGKPCPICEEAGRLYDAGKNKEGGALLPQRRTAYNFEVYRKGESQGLQIYEAAHGNYEKELISEAHACVEGNDIIQFADIDDGFLIRCRGEKAEFNNNKYIEFKSFQFKPREKEIDDEILDNAVSLDEAMVVLSYEEIEKIFFGIPEDEEEYEEEEEQPRKKKRPIDEDEEEDERPKKKDEDNPFDDSDLPFDEDEKPKKDKKNKCPHGYNYGKDADEYKECKKCKLWDDCLEGV